MLKAEQVIRQDNRSLATIDDDHYCGMCGWRENTNNVKFELPMLRLAYANTDEMNQTTTLALCRKHARQLRLALEAFERAVKSETLLNELAPVLEGDGE